MKTFARISSYTVLVILLLTVTVGRCASESSDRGEFRPLKPATPTPAPEDTADVDLPDADIDVDRPRKCQYKWYC